MFGVKCDDTIPVFHEKFWSQVCIDPLLPVFYFASSSWQTEFSNIIIMNTFRFLNSFVSTSTGLASISWVLRDSSSLVENDAKKYVRSWSLRRNLDSLISPKNDNNFDKSHFDFSTSNFLLRFFYKSQL